MFLNQIHLAWRDLGRPGGRWVALFLLGPIVVFALLALPVALRATPGVADRADLSGSGDLIGPQLHLHGSYQMTVTITGQAGCTYQADLYPVGSTPEYGLSDSFPSDAAASRTQVSRGNLPDVADGLYSIALTTTGCGPWTVRLDRATGAG
jgi:hypothetical protein